MMTIHIFGNDVNEDVNVQNGKQQQIRHLAILRQARSQNGSFVGCIQSLNFKPRGVFA